MKQKHATLLLTVIICLFLLQRGGLILFGYSHISHPGIDEPVSGVLPCDILDGQLRAPLFAYEYLNRSGDVLIEGLLLVPYFKILGRSIFSTKVLALTSALITFLCWLLFIKKYHGMVAAILFGLFYAVPPPMFARLNLIGTISSHHLLNPLIAVQSLLLFRIFEYGKGEKVPVWLWIGSGFLAGLGVYTFYTYIVFIGFCFLFFLLFAQQSIKLRSLAFLAGGLATGFSPWILRSLSSHAGGHFLSSMVKNISVAWWSFVQNFCFAVPHSLGYNYPSRAIGYVSVLLYLLIMLSIGIILKKSLNSLFSKGTALKERFRNLSPPYIQGLFCALFPPCFLICLSLSPMRINPFEYWPGIGLFATFNCADAIRYRWLHILFPFYFATLAIGIVFSLAACRQHKFYRLGISFLFIIVIVCGMWKSASLYSMKDFGKIFYYKGYNYDQFASKFILGDFAPHDINSAEFITRNYPEVNRGEAYRSYGTLIAERAVSSNDCTATLEDGLRKVPAPYRGDVMYGIARAAQNLSEQKFQTLSSFLIQKYPDLFYENWGFRYLGYKYYGLLVNRELLFKNIPVTEQKFYKKFLEKFKQEITDTNSHENGLLGEISKIPQQYQHDVLRGLGRLVGAEMLFDTLGIPDYPLDSKFGENLSGSLKEAFYVGVGSGLTETMCRFWRMLLLPSNTGSPQYNHRLDIEWNRCDQLMSRFPETCYPIIKKGFLTSLRGMYVPSGITQYINNKLMQEKG